MTVRFPLAFAALVLAGSLTSAAHAEPKAARWTGADDKQADLGHLVDRLNAETGLSLTVKDFKQGEDRDLAFNHYRRYDQVVLDVEVRNMALRVWTAPTGELIQLEARVDSEGAPVGVIEMESVLAFSRQGSAMVKARDAIKSTSDVMPRGVDAKPYWEQGRLVYAVTVKAHRGVHKLTIDALTLEVLKQSYDLYPRGDASQDPTGRGEFSVPGLIFPVYEEYQGQELPREYHELKYLQRQIARPTSDPYAPLRDRQYFWSKQDSVKGETAEGQAAGFWSMPKLRRDAKLLHDAIPLQPNSFRTGARFVGRFATINIYPEAFTAFPGVELPFVPSAEITYQWTAAGDDYEITPRSAALGKTLDSRRAAWERDATRDPNHNPAVYLNNGFDEVQVYYAINELFEALRPMGFVDPDLGERPFHAFLFDPDIESKDNAYYTDDTINFTTYTPGQLNMARDNTTIWHELGHGVMDRLMGTQLELADTGGLSEGMADFVAEMVLQAATGGKPFPGIDGQRIINSTGFFMTNEVHDDGEAYGGTMKDILDLALQKYGRAGLHKIVDLVLETMRLCRDNPGLTAEDWFRHMKFADTLGRPGLRAAGELTSVIDQALDSRNFAAAADRGTFSLKHDGEDIVAGGPGSRGNEIQLTLAPTDVHEEVLTVAVHDGTHFHYDFPVEVKIFYNSGPLQGAIDWLGEDQEPEVHVLNSQDDVLTLNLKVKGQCDAINRQDGSCSDFAYVQIWNKGATKPVAKKRFYLDIKNPTSSF